MTLIERFLMEKNSIGKRIKECRKNNKMSRELLAEKVGLSTSAMSYIESGKSYPTLPNFIKIANALNVSADTLLFDEIDASFDNPNTDFAKLVKDLPIQKRKSLLNLIELIIKTDSIE